MITQELSPAHEALRRYADTQDPGAFRLLVEQYQRLVYAAAGRRLERAQDVEDVVQSTFFKLARAARSVQRDLASWLYTTAVNAANELIRRDATRLRHESTAVADAPQSVDPAQDELQKLSLLVDDAILQLPADEQSLIVEHFFNGRSQRDLAADLNTSQSTIARRLHAAVDSLRARLAKLGYAAAAPTLAASLENVPQPAVPAHVTTQLAKIGLAGGSAPAAVATGAGIKLVLMILAVVLAGATIPFFFQAKKPAPLPAAAPAANAPVDPVDPVAALHQAYALAPGQALKFIPPGAFPGRKRYFEVAETAGNAMPMGVWSWTKGQPRVKAMSGGGPRARLEMVTKFAIDIASHQVVIEGLPRINADGDWVVRDGATPDEILADLKTILKDHYMLDVAVAKQEAEKDAIVVTGKYKLTPVPGVPNQEQLQVLGGPLGGGGTSAPADFWRMLGDVLGVPVVDESETRPISIDWLLSQSVDNPANDAARRQLILDNLSKQTTLTFTPAKRTFTTWKLTPVK